MGFVQAEVWAASHLWPAPGQGPLGDSEGPSTGPEVSHRDGKDRSAQADTAQKQDSGFRPECGPCKAVRDL